ncbi:MAG: hypothetical protein WC511_01550 [Candidatus Pacearchaeota archaeon]
MYNAMRRDFHRVFIFVREKNRTLPLLETEWGKAWFSKIQENPSKENELFLDMNSDYHIQKMSSEDFI